MRQKSCESKLAALGMMLLVVGSMAVIGHAERQGTKRAWLIELMKRRAKKVAAVALANKTARTVWALMTSGEHYREPQVAQLQTLPPAWAGYLRQQRDCGIAVVRRLAKLEQKENNVYSRIESENINGREG